MIVPLFLEFPLAVVLRVNLTSANEKCSGNERHENEINGIGVVVEIPSLFYQMRFES